MTYTFDTALARAERAYYAPPDDVIADPCDECDGTGEVLDSKHYSEHRASYWTEPDLWDDHPGDYLDEYMDQCWRCQGTGEEPAPEPDPDEWFDSRVDREEW
jgi:hypothetical protein